MLDFPFRCFAAAGEMESEEVGSSRMLRMVGGEADGPVELRKGIQQRLLGVFSAGNPAQPLFPVCCG